MSQYCSDYRLLSDYDCCSSPLIIFQTETIRRYSFSEKNSLSDCFSNEKSISYLYWSRISLRVCDITDLYLTDRTGKYR